RLEGHRFAPQCNFTGRNSRDVQQVIDKAYESSHLTVDDSECLLCGLIERRLFDRRQRVADSRDGIAELVRQHSEKFAFQAVRLDEFTRVFLQFALESSPVADIADIALNHIAAIFLVEVADELELSPRPNGGLLRQVLIPDD